MAGYLLVSVHGISEFPSYDRAVSWYNSPEYREVKEIRLGAADVQIAIADGAG